MIAVLVAVRNDVAQLGLQSILRPPFGFHISAAVTCQRQLLSSLNVVPHDVLLIEAGMLQEVGIDTLKAYANGRPLPRMLVLGHTTDLPYGVSVIKSGARGYLGGSCSVDELRLAVSTVAQGRPYITPELGDELVLSSCLQGDRLSHLQLSSRELQVFKMLALGLGVSAIGVQLDLSIKTVSTHKARILRKMKLRGMSELVRYAISQNLLRTTEPEPVDFGPLRRPA